MRRLLSGFSLPARMLVAIAIAILVAGIIAELYGAKSYTSYSNSIDISPQTSAIFVVAPIVSEGVATIEVKGADNVYYVRVTGDPFIIAQQFRSINLNVSSARGSKIDLRAGVSFTILSLESSPILVQAVSLLGEVIAVNRPQGQGGFSISEGVRSAESLLILLTADSPKRVEISASYRVTGYERLEGAEIFLAAIALLAVAIALEGFRRLALSREPPL